MAPTGAVPAGGRIAEVSLEDIVVRHGQETDVDLPLLAAADSVLGENQKIKQRDALGRRIKALTNSTSWRVTSPLRAIRQQLGLGRD